MKKEETKKELLTKEEKTFLKAVIKPYKKWVHTIIKYSEHILTIEYKKNRRQYAIYLPIYQETKDYQFKGLEELTQYDLDTLGL